MKNVGEYSALTLVKRGRHAKVQGATPPNPSSEARRRSHGGIVGADTTIGYHRYLNNIDESLTQNSLKFITQMCPREG